jgi:hypothetical protein
LQTSAAWNFARQLERELSALRADKTRLDWLEDCANFIEVGCGDISATRAAIDVAMTGGSK